MANSAPGGAGDYNTKIIEFERALNPSVPC